MKKTGQYGLYELDQAPEAKTRFRYGNHPVRHEELVREFGTAEVIKVYWDRELAKTEADRRNREG